MVTFLYGQHYACNESCKYYKNQGNTDHKFIPAVHRTFYDGEVSHVTGIVTVTAEEFAAMPPKCDGAYLREHFPSVAISMDRFIDKIKEETHGEIIGSLDVVRIPLDLYRARNTTSRKWHQVDGGITRSRPPRSSSSVTRRSARRTSSRSPSGFECAMYLADLMGRTELSVEEMFDRYEAYAFKQWLRVYMRSRMIKHNKDLLGSLDDTLELLEKLHIY